MASALLTLFGGFAAADAAASLVIGALVLYGTWGILRDSTRVLLEAAPPEVDQPTVCAALQSLEGVASVHDLHIWSIGSGQTILTAHLGLRPGASPAEVLARAQALLVERFRLAHSTLQVEPAGAEACRQANCGLLAAAPAAADHDADEHDDHDEHDHDDDDDHDHRH
jgi:cobalt-zinc-cadmium efflux system protein